MIRVALFAFALAFAAPAIAADLQNPLDKPYAAPEFAGLGDWINAKPQTLKSLRGKVVLVDFWTYSCINCIRTLPTITRWDADYRDKGLVIIGIHAPEFAFEHKTDNIMKAVKRYGITYPVAVDNDYATWNAYHNKYWPAHYLIDQKEQVVYTHFGEGADEVMEHNIRALLGLDMSKPMKKEARAQEADQTPETYLGYARADRYLGSNLTHDAETAYVEATDLLRDHWTLSGNWNVGAQAITAGKGASLTLHFRAKQVYLVLGSASGKPVMLDLTLNGKRIAPIAVQDHKLYTLVTQKGSDEGTLRIDPSTPGLEAYAFTFGS